MDDKRKRFTLVVVNCGDMEVIKVRRWIATFFNVALLGGVGCEDGDCIRPYATFYQGGDKRDDEISFDRIVETLTTSFVLLPVVPTAHKRDSRG